MLPDGEVRQLERGQRLFVVADRKATRAFRWAFEGASALRSGRRRWRATGPAPAAWATRLDEPECADPAEVANLLRRFAQGLGAPVRLAYSGGSSVRQTLGVAHSSRPQHAAYWALTGDAVAGPWTLPLGRSGRGDGLDTLRDGAVLSQLRAELLALASARPAPAGEIAVVLAPAAAALIAHEAVGHLAEASAAPVALGTRVAAEPLSFIDDPLAAGGPARYDVDDEGIRTLGPTRLVHDGRLVAHLHSRASASVAGAWPTANGRSASVLDDPLPRMSNLVCAAGELADGALVDALWSGLYVHRLADG
ncbi:MAG TPA: metallopeptidase TldD-related protein, partial [Solirubrobacter sp.]|nr:metallopeptidase TldD-related protein [Solirubrobacter sp.]